MKRIKDCSADELKQVFEVNGELQHEIFNRMLDDAHYFTCEEYLPCWKSCKVLYSPERASKAAADFVAAIKLIAAKPDNLDNLESYLSCHFEKWLEIWANSPEGLAAEMKEFAEMEI